MPSTSARQRSNDDRPRDITAPIVVAAVASPLTAAAKAEAVKAYIDQNQLAQTVESAVNSVLSRRPADCFGSMADVLGAEHGAAPVVERVVLGDGQQLCAQGNPCLSVDLIGQWRDRKVLLGSASVSYASLVAPDVQAPTESVVFATAKITSGTAMLIDKLSAEVTTACAKLTPLVQNALAGKVLRAQREVDDALRAVMPAQMTAVELAIVQLVSLAAFRAIAFKYPRGFGPSLLIAAKAGPKDAVVLPKLIFPMIAGNARLRMRDLSLVVDPRSAAISSMKDAAKLVVGISRAFGVTLNAKLPGMVVTGESRPPTAGNALAKGGKDAKKSGATAVSGDSVCTLADSGMYVMAGTVGVKLSQLIDWLLEAVSKSGAPAGAFGLAVRFNGNAMATVAEETGQPMIELHTGERLSTEEFAAELQRLISVYPTIQLMDSPVSKKNAADWASIKSQVTHFDSKLFTGDCPTSSRNASISLHTLPYISDALQGLCEPRDPAGALLLSTVAGEQLCADYLELAQVLRADFIMCGSPMKPEWMRMMNKVQALRGVL